MGWKLGNEVAEDIVGRQPGWGWDFAGRGVMLGWLGACPGGDGGRKVAAREEWGGKEGG